jgi:hypothetical protein
MAIPVLILGESGTGKSASLRNFQKGEVAVINVAGKPLPFRNNLGVLTTDNYEKIKSALLRMEAPSAVIDDAQYLLANEFMRRSGELGYQKFTDMAKNYWSLIAETVCKQMPPEKIVYFLSHIERDQNGNEKCKTIGKLLDEKITVEGLFTIVLKTHVEDGKYTFRTKNSGMDTVKSPIGLFETDDIDNDLKAVDNAIRAYYGLEITKEEEKND